MRADPVVIRAARAVAGVRGAEVLADEDELVAAEAGDGLDQADCPRQPAPESLQDGVPVGVPETVIDDFEVVDVDQQHRGAGCARGGRCAGRR